MLSATLSFLIVIGNLWIWNDYKVFIYKKKSHSLESRLDVNDESIDEKIDKTCQLWLAHVIKASCRSGAARI